MITSTSKRYLQLREAAACQLQPSIAAAAAAVLFCPMLHSVTVYAGQLRRAQHGCRQCSCRQLLGLTVMHSR